MVCLYELLNMFVKFGVVIDVGFVFILIKVFVDICVEVVEIGFIVCVEGVMIG